MRRKKSREHTHTLTGELTHTEQRLRAAAATYSDCWRSPFPLHWAACIRALVCLSPCLLMLTLGFFVACAQDNAHRHRNKTVYLWVFLLAVVLWAWQLGNVCLVLIWLHKIHQKRGFKLNRIFWLFIGWTSHTESYLMRHIWKVRRGSDSSWVYLNVHVNTFWMCISPSGKNSSIISEYLDCLKMLFLACIKLLWRTPIWESM